MVLMEKSRQKKLLRRCIRRLQSADILWHGLKKIISEVEKHDRECYGGYIAMEDDAYFIAHVNLRSFEFSPGYCCFWGGGGIMSESSPTAEWEEASLKISTSLSFFNKELGLGR